jgi:hypothetical protein
MSTFEKLAIDLDAALQENPKHSSTMYAEELDQLISSAGEHGGLNAHQKFLQICNLAGMSFYGRTPSKEEIQQNPATLPLIKFLLSALHTYHSEAARGALSNATQRRALLAGCFRLDEGKHGGNTRGRVWSVAKQQELVVTFSNALAGKSDPQSWIKAFFRTYESAFGADLETGREKKQRRKNQLQLYCLLTERGYSGKVFEVNLEELDK